MRRLLLCAAGLALAAPALALPAFEDVREAHRPTDTVVVDRAGEPLHRLRVDATVRRGSWTRLEDVSPALRQAMVLSEDKRFWEHSGVDWRAVSAAAWGNLWNERTRGASTISMQLAGLLDGDWRASASGRTVVQKAGQAVAAQVLDRRWRKDQILEAYLNLVPFRGEIVGIAALSRTLFAKAPSGLETTEAAIAAALVRAPNARASQVTQRACGVLRAMEGERTDCSRLDLQVALALQQKAFAASEGVAPHLARQLAPSTGAPRVVTTLRADVQRQAIALLRQHLRELRNRNVQDGAVVVLDNATGHVLAWVGSSGDLSQAAEVDAVTALRQPGSTLKPFLYAQALAERRITAASLLDDSPAHIPTAAGLYIPQNYDHDFKGWVSARTALGASLNVPAVRTLVMVSPDAFHRQLRSLGLPLRESGDYYGYSLALGSAEVSLLTLTNAYRALANGGRYDAVRWTPTAHVAGTQQVLDARAAFIVADILSDPNARARTFGTDSLLATRFWTAVKTGTSKDMRDNWAVGWSQHYTVGVWVGNARGAPMHDVSGTSGAAPIWAGLMQYLHRGLPSRPPRPPAGLQRQAVRFATHAEAAREEWFIAGTGQAEFHVQAEAAQAASTGPAHIVAPSPGTIIALDPDIPPARQRLEFLASGGPHVRWQVDGKPAGKGPRAAWLPWPGRHVVRLLDASGSLLDEVRVEVRGAGLKTTSLKPR